MSNINNNKFIHQQSLFDQTVHVDYIYFQQFLYFLSKREKIFQSKAFDIKYGIVNVIFYYLKQVKIVEINDNYQF